MFNLRAPYISINIRRGGRVVEGARLESVYTVTPYRGFESLSLRQPVLLWGDAGNDTLNGGSGNDTYLFSQGDGDTTIHNLDTGNSTDTLQLGQGIAIGQGIAPRMFK